MDVIIHGPLLSKGDIMENIIYDITTFTQLDYDGFDSCIVWLSGCNMACEYCHNTYMINRGNNNYNMDNLISFLEMRRGLLDAVVISGGECTMHPKILDICRVVKSLGYMIKIDTNGTNPEVLRQLMDEQLIDYVAIDFKGPRDKISKITKNTNSYEKFITSLDMLICEGIKFEVRTTIHSSLLNMDDINEMIEVLSNHRYMGILYLQNYTESEGTACISLPSHNRIDAIYNGGVFHGISTIIRN